MNRAFASLLFRAIESLRGERVVDCLLELERNQRLPADALRRLQQDKLRALLDFTVKRNPYYIAKYRGCDPHGGFSQLPLLTKDELKDHYPDIVTPAMGRKLDLVKTSGSTGRPLKLYRDRVVFGYTLAAVYRAHRWHGLDIGDKEAMLWGIPGDFRNRLRVRVKDALLNRFREKEYNLDPEVLGHFLRQMQRRRPAYVFGYTSMVYEFALFLAENGLAARDLGLKCAVCTAETIYPHQRAAIEAALGCKVVGEYGSAETGIISYECPHGSRHVTDDCVYVETLDEAGRPVPPGEIGTVVVTVLHSFSAPIIRYALGDFASLAEGRCTCGVNLSLMDKIVGRTGAVIVTPAGRRFHSIALYYIMKDYADKHGGIRQFRVRQTALDRLEFQIAASGEFSPAARSWLEQRAKEKFGADMRIEFRILDQIERNPSGKLGDFESTLDPAQVSGKGGGAGPLAFE